MSSPADSLGPHKVGSVRKCPSCGAALGAFVTACSYCGHEIAEVGANNTIAQLVERFEEIEREADLKGLVARSREEAVGRRRAQLIRDFPIPNSREDLQELLYYIQPKIVDSVKRDPNFEDWRAKFTEVLNRAKKAYQDDSKTLAEFAALERSLEGTLSGSLKMSARRSPWIAAAAVVCVLGAGAAALLLHQERRSSDECGGSYARAAEKEQARLDGLLAQVDREFRAGTFSEALMHSAGLRWELTSSCRESEAATARAVWEDKRGAIEGLIRKGQDAAVATQQAAADEAAAQAERERAQAADAARQARAEQQAEEARVAAARRAAQAAVATAARTTAADQQY